MVVIIGGFGTTKYLHYFTEKENEIEIENCSIRNIYLPESNYDVVWFGGRNSDATIRIRGSRIESKYLGDGDYARFHLFWELGGNFQIENSKIECHQLIRYLEPKTPNGDLSIRIRQTSFIFNGNESGIRIGNTDTNDKIEIVEFLRINLILSLVTFRGSSPIIDISFFAESRESQFLIEDCQFRRNSENSSVPFALINNFGEKIDCRLCHLSLFEYGEMKENNLRLFEAK
jgi:hypothetical protein